MSETLQELSPETGSKYTRLKLKNQELYRILEPNLNLEHPFDKWGKALGTCAELFTAMLTAGRTLQIRKIFLCKKRICPLCQMVASSKNRQLMLFKVEELRHTIKNPRYIFLTLTVPNCPLSELRATVQHMAKSWHRLMTTLLEKNTAIGGFVRKLEVTRNSKTDEAHPHFHVLIQVSPRYFDGHHYIKQEKWLQMWQKAMRNDAITQVNVQAVKQGDDQALLELTKYELKASELGHGELEKLDERGKDELSVWLAEYMRQMKHIRGYSSGGTLKMPKLEEMPDRIADEDDDEPIAEIIAEWRATRQNYIIKSYKEIPPKNE